MARTPRTAQEATPRMPPAETDNEFFASLLALRPAVEEACEGEPDIIKAALQVIAGGLNTLEGSIRVYANLERSHV